MWKAPKPQFEVAADQHKLGPDYFSYFTREVVELLSQDDIPPPHPHNSDSSLACPQFGDSIGPTLSDFKKTKLKALLRQSAVALSKEVNEMLEPTLSIDHLRSLLRSKTNPESVNEVVTNDVQQDLCQEFKSSSYANEYCANVGSSRVLDSELQFFLENDSTQVEEIVTNFANELSETLGRMEQQLEELLDAVMSKCRPLTLQEKQQLQKLIQKLPPENLGRAVEIIEHSTDKTDGSSEIHVDLDKENNATLWRLYYYVEAVERAKKLASG